MAEGKYKEGYEYINKQNLKAVVVEYKGRKDIVVEAGFFLRPAYQLYLQNSEGKFIRSQEFSQKDIADKLKN